MRLRACLLALAVVAPVRAFAQTPPPAAPPPPPPAEAAPPPAAPAPVVTPAAPAAPMAPPAAAPAPAPAAPAGPSPKFTFGGLADMYWMYYFNPQSGSNSLVGPTARAFDVNANSISLALAKLSMTAALDPVTFQLDIGYGGSASIINGTVSPMATQVTPSFMVEQAYGELALPGNLTLDFGKFTTTAGAEVIEANKNWLYSRSILFNVIPLVHTGARAGLKISDQLSLQASLVNGWNNDPDNNAWKTIGLNATFTASPMISVIPTVYFGKETAQPAGGSTPGDVRLLVDLVVPITINPNVGLNVNVDFIDAPNFFPTGATSMTPDNSSNYIFGVSAMGKFTINDHAYLSARGEFVRSHVGEGGVSVNNNMGEGTIMLGVPVGKNFEFRPEVRGDFSGDQIFAGDTKKDQFTGTLAALTFF
jgi:hypothetical protein